LLCGITAYELSEWEAYERAFGPLGRQYEQDMFARIHEQLQMITFVLGAANSGEGENPVPEPKQVPRPHEVFQKLEAGASVEEPAEQAMGLDEMVQHFESRKQ
jgi:hypothetical protein